MSNNLKLINESLDKIKPAKNVGLYEAFCSNCSEYAVEKEDILDWLGEHKQLWSDCENHFGQNPNRLSADELEGFICDHDQACKDYAKAFGLSLEENLNEDTDPEREYQQSTPGASKVTLFCELESYSRYAFDTHRKVKVTGKDHLEALKKLVDKLNLYITSDIIEEEEYTFEDAIEYISNINGDGCDWITKLTDDKGNTFIEEEAYEDDWEDLDEEKKPYVKTWDPKMQGYYDGRFYITELEPKEKPGRFTGIVDLSRDEDGHPIDEGKSFDFDKINKKLHGNVKLKNESLLKEDQMDTNYRAFLQRINNALQLLDNYIALTSKSISPSKNTDKKIAQDGLQALKLLYKYIQQKPGR